LLRHAALLPSAIADVPPVVGDRQSARQALDLVGGLMR
jgi:hypothetical protein